MSKRAKHNADGQSAESGGKPESGSKPESIAEKLYASAGAVVAGIVARKVVEKAWVKATGKVPPKEPESPSVHWAEAVGWSVVSGTTVAIARLLATRKAAGAWKRVSDDNLAAGPAATDSRADS